MRYSFRVIRSYVHFILSIVILLIDASASFAQEGASIYERSIRSVVTIEGPSARGSGFVVAPQVIVTNYHVVSGMPSAHCYIDKWGERYEVDGFLEADEENDLILLKVSDLKEKPLALSPYEARPGQRIYVIGSPEGMEGTISEGLVSSLRMMDGVRKIQMSAPISHGSSGGPVLNVNGDVLGISCSGLDEGENINFAVPIEQLKKLLARASTKVQDLSSLPPMEKDDDDVSESNDMGRAELIYDIGFSEEDSPLTLDYLAHFRDSTCFYFTYDLTRADESDTISEYWLSDYRIIDIGSGDVIKPIRSNLTGNEDNPHRVYRGTSIFYSITFPRLSPSVRNFHLLEGNCDENDYCFRDIRLRDYKTADGLDWATFEYAEPEGTVSFYTRSKKEKYTITISNVTIGSLSEPWHEKNIIPNCGNTGTSVVTARLPVGTYTYQARGKNEIIVGKVTITAEGCLVEEL